MKFTTVTTQLVCIWIILAVIQLSDPLPKSNKTLSIPLIRQKKSPKHMRKRDVSDLPLKSVDADFFYGWIKCGTPGQPLRCIFDTGSSDLWVMSADLCKDDPRICAPSCGHYTYDKIKSRTYRDMRQEWSIEYQDGSQFSGHWCEDNVEVGELLIINQIYAVATFGDQDDPCNEYDGIFGLGYHDRYRRTCAFRNMMRQNLVTYPVFSFYLNREQDNSVLLLGDSDPQYYRGDLAYTEVVEPNSWTIEFTSIWIGDQRVMGRSRALVDSGTSLILCPPDFMDAFQELVGDPDTLDCEDMPDMPDIIFQMEGGFRCVFHPEDYMIEEDEDERYAKECMCGVDSSDQDLFILGILWMGKYYTMFNMAEGLVGVALAR